MKSIKLPNFILFFLGGGRGANKTLESQDSANNPNFPAPEAFPDKHPAVIPFLQRVGFPREQEEGEHQWIPKKSWECVPPCPSRECQSRVLVTGFGWHLSLELFL